MIVGAAHRGKAGCQDKEHLRWGRWHSQKEPHWPGGCIGLALPGRGSTLRDDALIRRLNAGARAAVSHSRGAVFAPHRLDRGLRPGLDHLSANLAGSLPPHRLGCGLRPGLADSPSRGE